MEVSTKEYLIEAWVKTFFETESKVAGCVNKFFSTIKKYLT